MGKSFDEIVGSIAGGSRPGNPAAGVEKSDSAKVDAGGLFESMREQPAGNQDANAAAASGTQRSGSVGAAANSSQSLLNQYLQRAEAQAKENAAKQKAAKQPAPELSDIQRQAIDASTDAVPGVSVGLEPEVKKTTKARRTSGGPADFEKYTAKSEDSAQPKIIENELKSDEKTAKSRPKSKMKQRDYSAHPKAEKKTKLAKAIEEAVGKKSGLDTDEQAAKRDQDFYNKYVAGGHSASHPTGMTYEEANRVATDHPKGPTREEVYRAAAPNSLRSMTLDELRDMLGDDANLHAPINFGKPVILSPTREELMGAADKAESPTLDEIMDASVEPSSPTQNEIMGKSAGNESPTLDEIASAISVKLENVRQNARPKNVSYEDILDNPAISDLYNGRTNQHQEAAKKEKTSEDNKAEGVQLEERTDDIAAKLKTPDKVMDEKIGTLKENAKSTAPAPSVHERKDDTVARSKSILSFYRTGIRISSEEKVKVDTDDAKRYYDERAEKEIEGEGEAEAVKTTQVPSRMTRKTFEEIEEFSKNSGAKQRQKELKDKRQSLMTDLTDVKNRIKELEARDKESLSDTDREINTAKLYGQRRKAKELNDEINKIGKQLGLKENKVVFSSGNKINFNRFKNQKGKNFFNKKGKGKSKGKKARYSAKTGKTYKGKKQTRSYAFRKENATDKAKKLKMKEVTIYSDEFEGALVNFANFLKLDPESPSDRHMMIEMASIYFGICPDRKNKLFNKPIDKVKLEPRIIMDAWKQMEKSYRETGFLFSYMDYNYKIAGNFRFVIPIMPPKIAKRLTKEGALLEGWTVEELARAGYNEWMNYVVPSASINAKKDQRLVLNDLMKAIAWSYGDASLTTGLLSDDVFTINEAFDSLNDYASLYPEQKDLVRNNEKCRQRVIRARKRVDGRNTRTVRGEDGSYKTLIDIAKNSPDVFATIVKLQRAQSLMFDVTLGASSALEHMKGNFSNSMAAKMMLSHINASGPTAATYEMAKTVEVQKTIMDAVQLLQVGGPDALIYAVDSGYVLGQGDARDFAKQFLLKRGLSSEEAQNYMNMSPNERANWLKQNKNKAVDLIDKYANLASNFATGEWVCQSGDAKRFFEFMLYNGQKDRDKGGMNLDPITLERMLMADPQGTITGLVARPEGINSLVTMMDCTLGGMNPLTSFYDDIMGRLGICDLAFANFVTLFPKYGFMAIGKVMPLSHTGMYAASFGYYFTKSVVMHFTNGTKIGDIEAADTKDRLDTLIGGQSMRAGGKEILNGLFQNFMMDFAQFGTNVMFFLIQLGTLMMLGFKEPPDEDKKFVYSEWRLFTNLTPDGEGVQIKSNWFLNEIYGMIGGPAVLSVAIYLKDKNDGATALQVFGSGFWDIMMNTGVSQISKFAGWITDFDKAMVESQTGEQVEGGDPLWNKILMTAASGAVGCIEPRFIKTLYSSHDFTSEGNLAHSTSNIYDPNSDDGGTMKTTSIDAAWRRLAYNDPLMALLLDAKNFLGGEKNATGYFRNEMPLVEEPDPTSMIWKKRFGEVDGRELTWDSSDEDKQIIVDRVLDAYDRYGGIEGMIDNGIVVPYVARYYTTSYLYACQNANWNSFYERQYSKGGFSSQEERQEASDTVQQANAKLNEKIKAIQDSRLPYSPYTLNRYETDYWKYYFIEDENGNRTPTNPWSYKLHHDFLKDPSYKEEYYASGDHKSSLNPYLMVDDENTGTFDRQKAAPWYNEDGKLDKDKLLEDVGDEVITAGQFKGQKLSDVIGGQLADQDGWIPTTGSRASVDVNQPWGNDYDWPNKKDSNLFTGNLGENGKNKTSEEWKESNKSATNPSSAGWGYTSSRRYSGSGRAASIYSRPASSLNADRAATMYSKNRNYTRYDYLRPDFETKGSRDAYKRSDI